MVENICSSNILGRVHWSIILVYIVPDSTCHLFEALSIGFNILRYAEWDMNDREDDAAFTMILGGGMKLWEKIRWLKITTSLVIEKIKTGNNSIYLQARLYSIFSLVQFLL